MESGQVFPYEPLCDDEIRLVKLLPSQEESDDIICELESAILYHGVDDPGFSHERGCNLCGEDTERLFYHCETCDGGDFDLCPTCIENGLTCKCDVPNFVKRSSYDALSYVWGNTTVLVPITLNGQQFDVTVNLECALRHFRLGRRSRILWVDAICIDQKDIEEKNSQLRHMGRVYEQSKVTLAWLGEASENSDSAMDFLDELEKLPTLSEKDAFLIRQMMLEPYTETGYGALFKLFCRPWWTRMRIVQELLLSKTVVLWCGDRWEYWGKLAQFHDLLTMAQHAFVPEISWPRQGAEAYNSHVLPLDHLRSRYIKESSFNIRNALLLTREFNCQDPRDKVFGLLGMISHEFIWDGPMYELPAIEVYQSLCKQLILHFSRLEVLDFAGIPHLPTWAPNLSLASDLSPSFVGGEDLYNAGIHDKSIVSFSDIDSKMTIRGVHLDYISRLVLPSFSEGPLQMPDMRDLLSQLPSNDYISGGVVLDAFKRTTLADAYDDENLVLKRVDGPALDLMTSAFDLWSFEEPIDLWTQKLAELHPEKVSQLNQGVLAMMEKRFHRQAWERSFFITPEGCIGLAPTTAQPGDLICVFIGSAFPFLLRPVGDEFRLVGGCYVHGIMDGEADKDTESGRRKTEEFIFI